jgi:hypothetical protein
MFFRASQCNAKTGVGFPKLCHSNTPQADIWIGLFRFAGTISSKVEGASPRRDDRAISLVDAGAV